MIHTVLSRAGAHGHSQLKCQNLRVGGYTKNSLKWFNYPRARAHPGCEVSCMGLNGLASSVRPWFVKASPTVEKAVSCYKANRLIASLLSFRSVQSSLAVCEFRAAGEECYKQGYGQRRCEQTFDAWCHVAEVHQNYCSYVRSVDLPSLRKNLAWWVVTWRTLKNHKTVKNGEWALARDNTVFPFLLQASTKRLNQWFLYQSKFMTSPTPTH